MQVTLDIFSGQPNPSWAMCPESQIELAKRLTGLPRARQVPGGSNLGYRGFVITNHTAENGLPTEVRVCEGLVTTKNKAVVATFCDTNDLEKWLVEQAREHGFERLLDTVPGL